MNIGKAMTCLLIAIFAFPAILTAQMFTPWGENVTPENVWRGYPRPQMVRANWTNLNGEWDYAITSVTSTPGRPEKWDGKILVPFPIESALSGVGRLLKPDEFLWYTRTIECDPKPGERIRLHFGGVIQKGLTLLPTVPIAANRQLSLALRWTTQFAAARHGAGMPAAVAAEIIDAFQGQGNVIKKRDDVHKMAAANKAFAHYAW